MTVIANKTTTTQINMKHTGSYNKKTAALTYVLRTRINHLAL